MNTILEKAMETMNPSEIDHHESDLYLKVNETSQKLIDEYPFKMNVSIFTDQISGAKWYDIPFAWYDIAAHKAYQKYQLRWMIDHDYSLKDLVNIMQELYEEEDHYDERNTSPLNLFRDFEQFHGFDGTIYACFDEWYENDYKE